MIKQKLLAAVFLLALGTVIGGVNAGNPTSEHWSLHIYLPGVLGSGEDMRHFKAPVFADEDNIFVVTVGPLHPLLLWLYNHFSFGHPAIAWIKGGATGVMLAGAFLMLLSLGVSTSPAFVASILVAFSPPVVFSTWKVTQETNVVAVALFFFSVALFASLRGASSAPRRVALFLLFLLFSIMAALVKDSIKGYMPVFFILLIYFDYKRDKNIHKWQVVAAAVFIVSLAVIMFAVRQPSMKPAFMGQVMPESFALVAAYTVIRKAGLFVNALVQFGFCFHAAASLLICAGFREDGRLSRNGLSALALIWTAPAVTYFTYHGMVVYPLVAVFSSSISACALVVSLCRIAVSRRNPENLFAAMLLYGLALVGLVTTSSFSMRDDASPRYFLAVIPFLATLIAIAFRNCEKGFIRNLLAASVAFFMLSYFFNTAQEFRNFDRVELAGKKHLAGMDLSEKAILYNNEFSPVLQSDLIAIGMPEKSLKDSRFALFEPFKTGNYGEKLRQEVCMKSLGLTWKMETRQIGDNAYEMSLKFPDRSFLSPKKEILFYEVYQKSMDGRIASIGDHNSYAGYEIFAPRILARSDFMASRGYWEHSAPDIADRYYTGSEPDFKALTGAEIYKEFEYSRTFRAMPPWLESIPLYLIKGVPLIRKVEAASRIRSVSLSTLNCEKDIDKYLSDIDAKIKKEHYRK